MSAGGPNRRWRGGVELVEMLEGMPGGLDLAVRDFALVTLAGELSATFAGQLVFKGGFVLRHAHGHLRFSSDVDATRHAPPALRLDPGAFANAIREASIPNVVRFSPGAPATDSESSLDFDRIRVSGEVFPDSQVQVEVSYREAVVGTPIAITIGHPFYEPFAVLTMETAEMAAEKLRALTQRLRGTDLADLAVLLLDDAVQDDDVARYAVTKFELVAHGRANRIDRIERNLRELADTYDDVVPPLFPDAPNYREAFTIVWPRIKPLVP